MTTITINIDRPTAVYPRGTRFSKDGKNYVLYIDPNSGKHIAALVNVNTGEGIHKPKEVVNATHVTAAELATLNFKKSSPAIAY